MNNVIAIFPVLIVEQPRPLFVSEALSLSLGAVVMTLFCVLVSHRAQRGGWATALAVPRPLSQDLRARA